MHNYRTFTGFFSKKSNLQDIQDLQDKWEPCYYYHLPIWQSPYRLLKVLIQTYLLAQWGQFTSHQASLGHHPVSMGTHQFSSALTGTHWLSMAPIGLMRFYNFLIFTHNNGEYSGQNCLFMPHPQNPENAIFALFFAALFRILRCGRHKFCRPAKI